MRKLPIARLDKPVRLPTDLYFIQTGCSEGHIKIGITSDVSSRMGKMQIDCPYNLTLLKLVKDAAHMERELHARFAGSRLRGEWFLKTAELLEAIDALPGYEKPAPVPISEFLIPLENGAPDEDDLIPYKTNDLALDLWREYQDGFPSRAKRLKPDQRDIDSGLWASMLEKAERTIAAGIPVRTVV